MEKTTVVATNENVTNYIHDDIAFSILSKLSFKSFKRFECVRKSWSLLFENHHFMNMFHNNFFSNLHSCSYYYDQSSLLLKVYEPYQEVLYFLSGERFENKVKLDYSNSSAHQFGFRIFSFGSINDTLCLHEYDNYGKIVLWNPSTQAIKPIPLSLVESIELSIPDDGKDLVSINVLSYLHGFGYDSVTNDYKVIRYVCFVCNTRGRSEDIFLDSLLKDISLDSLWEIYSLRSNLWRKLDVDMPYSLECNEGTQVYMDGVCHWLCEDDYESSQSHHNPSGACLVSFDLSNDVFITTPVPSNLDDCFYFGELWINLVVLNESIALISFHEKTVSFHISILGELAIKESWAKLVLVGPLHCVERPIEVGMKGEIFFIRKDGELAWLDLSTKMIEELGYKVGGPTARMIIYKENILSRGI